MKKLLPIFLIVVLMVLIGGGYYLYSQREEPITDPMLRAIQARGKLLVGVEATYPPMEYKENGVIVGYDMDLAKEIAKSLAVSVEFVDTPWDTIFTDLNANKYDMIASSVTILPERLEDMSFSDPYFNAGQTIIVANTTTNIKSPQDLKGKKVGLQKGTTSEPAVVGYAGEEAIVDYETYDPAPADLKAAKIDAIVIDYPAGLGIIKRNTGLKMVGDPFTQEFYGIAVRKGDTELLTQINKVIRDLKQSGKLSEIEDVWFK